MDSRVAEEIVNASDCEVFENYSGRGMYGKTTTAVTCDSINQFVAAVARAAVNCYFAANNANDDEDAEGTYVDPEFFAEEMESLRCDNLALGYVFY
jgi:hypothetical protein